MLSRRNYFKLIAQSSLVYFLNNLGFKNAKSSSTKNIFVGLCSIYDYINDTTNFETYVNFKHDILQYFSSFDVRVNPDMITPYFKTIPLNIWNSGRIPFLSWYPSTSYVYPTPTDICQRICNHEFDSYLLLCCNALKGFFNLAYPDPILGTPKIFLRFAHEMNINTNYYSNAANFILMWRYVYDFLRNNGITENNLQFIFCPNCMDVGTVPFENFYPGDEYVNWNGLDGYNWGETYWQNTYWRSFEDLFVPALTRMTKLSSKPIAICEFGTTCKVASGYDLAAKSQWLQEAFGWLSTQNNLNTFNIKMAIYYNLSKQNDIDSGIFIPSNYLIDSNFLNFSYQNYMTIQGLNSYYYNQNIGFKNNNMNISSNIFKGNF